MSKKKEKLLIIAGAGASVSFDMFSSSDIESMFEANGPTKIKVRNHPESLYKYIKQGLLRYHRNRKTMNGKVISKKERDKISVYFEEVVYQLLNIYSMQADHHKNGATAFFDLKKMPLKIGHKKVNAYDYYNEANTLVADLLDKMREKCSALSRSKITSLKSLLLGLDKEFQLGVVNLNYDNILYQCMPSKTEIGFDNTGSFNPDLVLNNTEWNFFYHLHGSVHFYYDNFEIKFAKKCTLKTAVNSNKARYSHEETTEGFPILTSPIIVGYGKAWQIQREPYLFYYNDLARRINEADKILFIGYSFGDLHLNKLIQMSLRHQKKKKIVIIDYAQQGNGILHRQDNWSSEIFKIMRLDASEFRPCLVTDLSNKNPFERNTNKSVALSYKGLDFFMRNPALLVSELK